MSDPIHPVFALPTALADSQPQAPPPVSPIPQRVGAALAAPEPEHDVRLTIDRASGGDYFVYTLTDRVTGRVLAQLPRDEVRKLQQAPDYTAGALVRTKA